MKLQLLILRLSIFNFTNISDETTSPKTLAEFLKLQLLIFKE